MLAFRTVVKRCSVAFALMLCACPRAKPRWLPWESAPAGAPDVSRIACLAYPGGSTADLGRLEQLGAAQVRWEISWSWVEKQAGVFDFSAFDGEVSALHDAGLEQILILDYSNPLYSAAGAANGGDDKYPPDDPASFARYVSAIVGRYGDRVKRWEVWNEENGGFRFWKPQADAAAYAALLDAASDAVKAACSDCEVILGAPVSLDYPAFGVQNGPDFLRAVAAAGGTKYDAAAVHPYMLYPPCSPPEGGPNLCAFWSRDEVPFSDQIAQVRDAAGAGKPWFATEYGWPTFKWTSGKGSTTEAMQADWLERGMLLAAQAGAGAACWFTLADDPATSGGFPPEGDFGLVTTGGAPKAAYGAFETMAQLFGAGRGAWFVRDRAAELKLRAGEHALLFAWGDKLVTALWREESAAGRRFDVRLFGPASLVGPAPGGANLLVGGDTATLTLQTTPLLLSSGRP